MDQPDLARSQLLGRLEADALRGLIKHGVQRSFAPGQILFQQGDVGDGMYVLASGEVRVVIEDQQGGEVTIAMLRAGDVLGELSLLDGESRSASAVAHEPTATLYISRGDFRAWLIDRPASAVVMLGELARRLRGADEQMAEIALLNLETRIARRIWPRFVASSPDAAPQTGTTIRVNQSELALELGVTRESVNKHLARLRTPGIVAVRANDVTLLQPDRLRELAELPD